MFSVERNASLDATVIGYTRGAGVEEWYLPVSPAKHDELVRRFRAKIGQPPITSYHP